MSDYNIIYRSEVGSTTDAPLWEPGCPIQVLVVQVPRNTKTAKTYLQLKVKNVSSGAVGSIIGEASVVYSDGQTDSVNLGFFDADIQQSETKALKATPLPKPNIESVSVTIKRTEGEKGTWESSEAPIRIPVPESLELSELASCERSFRLTQNGVNPQQLSGRVHDEGAWWICSCGQLNLDRGTCCECGVNKQDLFNLENDSELSEACLKRKEEDYNRALELVSAQPKEESLSQAITLLEDISPWKDADALIVDLKNQMNRLKRKNNKRIIIVIVAFVVVSILLMAIIGEMTNNT